MSDLARDFRPIETESYAAIEAEGDPGPAPMLRWIAIAELVVDDSYQRPLAQSHIRRGVRKSSLGRKNVRAIAERFSWTKFSPVIVAPVEGGKFAIIDGQHRTTAAALRGIESVPCQVVIAGLAEQAAAFASINGTVTRMHALAVHHAAIAAGDPEALKVRQVTDAAGVTVLRYPKPASAMAPGETLALVEISRCVARFGGELAATALSCVTGGVNNKPGVLQAPLVRALCVLLADRPDLRGRRAQDALDKLNLARELEHARGRGRPVWQILLGRLEARLGKPAGLAQSGAASALPSVPAHPGDRRDPVRAEPPSAGAGTGSYELDFVRKRRAANVPWSHIAQQLGVRELDLRARHDPQFQEARA